MFYSASDWAENELWMLDVERVRERAKGKLLFPYRRKYKYKWVHFGAHSHQLSSITVSISAGSGELENTEQLNGAVPG